MNSMDCRSSVFFFLAAVILLAAGSPPAQAGGQPGRKSQIPDLPTVYGALKLSGQKIVVDGDAGEWPELRSIPLFYPFQVSGGQGYRGERDLAGRAFFCWDRENLYLCLVVQDDFHRPLAELTGKGYNPAGPVGDGFYLRFDPRRDTRSMGPVPERREDRLFWFGLADKEKPRVLRLDRPGGKIALAPGVDLAARVVKGKKREDPLQLRYEARIPWPLLLPSGEKPAGRRALGLEVVLEDFDSPLDTLPQTRLGWTFASGPILYPGNMGTLLLLEEALPDRVRPRAVPRPMPGKEVHLGAEPAEHWEGLSGELDDLPPGAGMPGRKRRALLERIDRGLAAWPPLDTGVLVSRWQRFMNREFKGIAMDRGAPVFLRARCKSVLRIFAEKAPREGALRLVRLPWSGWLVRSKFLVFTVDPFLPGLHKYGGRVDAVFLTNGLDPLRRDDQLITEVVRKGLPCFAHVPLFIPRFDSRRVQLVRPGDGVDLGAAEVVFLGPPPPGEGAEEKDKEKEEEPVTSIGFDIRFRPAGPRLVFGGRDLRASWVTGKGATGKLPIEILSLPLDHPRLEEVLAGLAPRLFLPADVLDLPYGLEREGVTRLEAALERLRGIEGRPWRLLAWGEKLSLETR